MNGWKMQFPFGMALFSGAMAAMLVSERVSKRMLPEQIVLRAFQARKRSHHVQIKTSRLSSF